MRSVSNSTTAATAIALIQDLQHQLKARLEGLADDGTQLTRVEWLRDGGRHGGGVRFELADRGPFNRASVNMSHVHYDDDDVRPLRSATALSSIIHPAHPRAPSLHRGRFVSKRGDLRLPLITFDCLCKRKRRPSKRTFDCIRLPWIAFLIR